MNVSICVYPWAFDTPGGGERQLQNYVSALERGRARWPDLAVSLYDMWNPQLQSTDLMHYFGCMPSSVDFLSHVKSVRRVPLVISPNFWPDPEGWAKSGVLDHRQFVRGGGGTRSTDEDRLLPHRQGLQRCR